MRSLSDISRPSPLALLGMTAAVALCWVTGLADRRYGLSIGDGPFRDDYLVATGSGLAFASVLALGLLALAVLRAPWWLLVPTAGATAHHAVLAVSDYQTSGTAPVDGDFGYGGIDDGVTDALMPGSWPLLVVVLAATVALLRAPRTRAPRPLPGLAQWTIAGAFVLAALTGLVGWWMNVYFIFEGEAEPADYQNAIVTAVGTAGLLVLGALLVRARWGTWWPVLPAAFGVLVQAFVVLSCLQGAQGAPDPGLISPSEIEVRFSLEYAALIPTSWPLLAVLALAIVTATPGLRRAEPGTGRVSPWSQQPGRLGADAP